MKKFRNIPIGTLNIGAGAKKLINKALDQNRLSYGPLTKRFERNFAKQHDSKYAMFTASGTCALQVALHTLKHIHKWKDYDEVLVPSVTFIATSNIVITNNLKPVFVEVDPTTYNINPKEIEKHITKKTRAIIPVHLFGLPADMDEILAISKKYNLKVIEDSCEAMGVKYKDKSVGSIGDIGCFSTYVAHLVTTGIGGLSTTNNPEYAVKMKSLMNHGRDSIYLSIDDDKDIEKKTDKEAFQLISRRFSFVDVGYSFRVTEMEAALGIEQLQKLKSFIRKRNKNASYLIKHLQKYDSKIMLPTIPTDRGHSFLGFPITIIDSKIKRDLLVTHLEKRGIETRYAMPLTNQPIYRKLFGDLDKKYPIAKHINENAFYIGCHQGLTKDDMEYIIASFDSFFEKK